MITLSNKMLSKMPIPKGVLSPIKCAAFSFQSFRTVGDRCSGTVGEGAAEGLLVMGKSTLQVADFSWADRYGQLLAGLGKGGKLKCSIKPEERTTTLKPETEKVLL